MFFCSDHIHRNVIWKKFVATRTSGLGDNECPSLVIRCSGNRIIVEGRSSSVVLVRSVFEANTSPSHADGHWLWFARLTGDRVDTAASGAYEIAPLYTAVPLFPVPVFFRCFGDRGLLQIDSNYTGNVLVQQLLGRKVF